MKLDQKQPFSHDAKAHDWDFAQLWRYERAPDSDAMRAAAKVKAAGLFSWVIVGMDAIRTRIAELRRDPMGHIQEGRKR